MFTLPVDWTGCTHQGHIDDLRLRHDDVGTHPSDRDSQTALWQAVGALLDHLDGKHRDDCRVWALTPVQDLELKRRPLQEPDIYERRAMGVHE